MKNVWLTLTVVLLGCGGPARETSGPPGHRDSAGFEIVENTRAIANLPVWRINPTALTKVGGDTSTFIQPSGARQLGDGSIMVSDARAAEVKLFDSTGALIKLLARKGQGPGEFATAGPPMRLSGDTTYVFDQFTGRLLLFSGPDLAPTTVMARRPSIPLVPIGWVTADTGIAAAVRFEGPTELGARYRTPIPYVRFTMQGAVVDTIAIGRGYETYAVPWSEGGKTGVGGRAVAMGSETQAAVVDRRFYLAETGEALFRTFDLLHGTRRIVRWTTPPDPVTAADRRDWVAMESTSLANNSPRGESAARAQALANLRKQLFAERGPYSTGFLPADDGGVWLEQYSRPWTLTRRYLVFDSTGTLTARVELPPRIRPFQILGDRMVARWRNEDDVDYIRIYRIEK